MATPSRKRSGKWNRVCQSVPAEARTECGHSGLSPCSLAPYLTPRVHLPTIDAYANAASSPGLEGQRRRHGALGARPAGRLVRLRAGVPDEGQRHGRQSCLLPCLQGVPWRDGDPQGLLLPRRDGSLRRRGGERGAPHVSNDDRGSYRGNSRCEPRLGNARGSGLDRPTSASNSFASAHIRPSYLNVLSS